MHTRQQSGSHRVNVYSALPSSSSSAHSSSPSPTSLRDYPSKPRRRTSGHGDGLLATAHRWSWNTSSWMSGRVGRTGLRRWMLVAGLGVVAVLALSSRGGDGAGGANGGGWSLFRTTSDPLDNPDVPPTVDRSALEKLRLLEIHFGADEEDPAEDLTGASYASTRRLRDPDAPPLVAEIPEPVKPNPAVPVPLAKVPAEVLDEETCGARDGATCQFLVPAWLGEQETKAQQHLYQLGLLALALNRTLVLPNVSKSRLGTCYKNPFSFYYSPDSLSDLNIPTISQEDFVSWTMRRDPPPSAQVVNMGNALRTYPSGAIEIDSASDPTLVPNKPSRNLCLRAPRTRLDFAGHSPLAIYPPEGFHKSEDKRLGFGESVVTTLRSREVGSKSSRASASLRAAYNLPDVLAFNYELRFPILSPSLAASFASPSPSLDEYGEEEPRLEPLPFQHFPYAQTWTDLGAELAAHLSPYIAVHWRTETLTPSNLAPCAQSLLGKLLALQSRHPELKTVYLATDYPIEALDPSFGDGAAVAHSGTFAKVVTEQHHAAMRRFLRNFERQAQGRLRLTTFAKELPALAGALSEDLAARLVDVTTPAAPPSLDPLGVPSPPPSGPPSTEETLVALRSLSTLDSGLLGILDKEVAVRAELFLTGVPGVGSSTKDACAKLSSFTNQLVGAREGRREAQRVEEERETDGVGEEREEEDGEEEGEREREERFTPGRLWNAVAHFSLSGEEVD
ncbi:hypothetical protein JCM8097_000596 [Rhodosporidiobolus ruineniae]